MIIDTTVIVDLLRGERTAIARVRALEGQGETMIVPAPVIYEVAEGAENSDRAEQEQRRVSQVLRGFSTLALTEATAGRAGKIAGRLTRQGITPDPLDIMIGAVALDAGDSVLTRNVKDFGLIPDLDVVPY